MLLRLTGALLLIYVGACAIDTGVPHDIVADLGGVERALAAVSATVDRGLGHKEIQAVLSRATTLTIDERVVIPLEPIVDDGEQYEGLGVWVIREREDLYYVSFRRSDQSRRTLDFIRRLGDSVPPDLQGQ